MKHGSYVLSAVSFETRISIACFQISAVLSISKYFLSLDGMAPISSTLFVSAQDKIVSASNMKYAAETY